MSRFLMVGGLVAAGFDSTGKYLLTVSHSGRGLFRVTDWEKVARDLEIIYPENDQIKGIGPISGELVRIVQKDYETETFRLVAPDSSFTLYCTSYEIEITYE